MAKRLFSYSEDNLRQAEEISEILEKNNIEYYETPASRWGFSRSGIWIKNNEDFDRAKELFEQHVQDFAQRAREAYQQETGYNPNAPLNERLQFYIRFIRERKSVIPVVVVGLGLIGLVYYFFFTTLFGN